MDLTLCVRPGDCGTIVRVEGDIDVCTEGPLGEALLRIMRTCSPWLLLDLSAVSFMDCAGLRALVRTRRRAELRKGSMCLIAASAAVRKVIKLTKMRNAFPVHDHWMDGGDGGQARLDVRGPGTTAVRPEFLVSARGR